MVPPAANWAFLEGVVQAVRPGGGDDLVVDLFVDRVDPDPPYPNFFGEELQTAVAVLIPERTVRELDIRPGVRVRCRAKKGLPFAAVVADRTNVSVLDGTRGAV